jgi:hypothetical protein
VKGQVAETTDSVEEVSWAPGEYLVDSCLKPKQRSYRLQAVIITVTGVISVAGVSTLPDSYRDVASMDATFFTLKLIDNI